MSSPRVRDSIKQGVKRAFNAMGFEILRVAGSPEHSLVGLRRLPVRTVIDVGANRGQFARRIAAVFPEADIYCFEPLVEPFEELKVWADRKRQGRIRLFNVALGEYEGTGEVFYHAGHPSSSSLLRSTELCGMLYPFTKRQVLRPVRQTTLDEAVGGVKLDPEILIKLDVQGYEDRVIRGGSETFRKANACIVEIGVEILYEHQATFADIVVLLGGLGYRYAGNLEQAYADDGRVVSVDAVFLK